MLRSTQGKWLDSMVRCQDAQVSVINGRLWIRICGTLLSLSITWEPTSLAAFFVVVLWSTVVWLVWKLTSQEFCE